MNIEQPFDIPDSVLDVLRVEQPKDGSISRWHYFKMNGRQTGGTFTWNVDTRQWEVVELKDLHSDFDPKSLHTQS
jgi:hypothetical protein